MPRVVTCLLIDDVGKLLILKRSDKVRTYKGMWGGIAGYIEENEEPLETALKEIKEEIGLDNKDVQFIKKLEPIKFTDYYENKKYDWEIFVFLFKTGKKDKLIIDWEHSESSWISPSEIVKFVTSSNLFEVST